MPTLTPLPNPGSQLDRAIAAYLVSVGAGTVADVFTSTNANNRTLPNTTVKAHVSRHDLQSTGNEIFMVALQFKFKAGAVGSEINRIAIDNRVGLALAAMMQTDNNENLDYTAAQITAAGRALAISDPTNNADMSDFTCQNLYYKGMSRGEPDDESVAFVEVRNFEAGVCPSNVS